MIVAFATALFLAQTYYTPEEAKGLFNQANEAYSRQDFRSAEEGFRKLCDKGFGGPDVWFNLGTTYLAQEKLGEAVLFLERARRAAPPAAPWRR